MEKIDILLEQTEFLLDRQRDVRNFFKENFNSLRELLAVEREKAERAKAVKELTAFQNVYSLIEQQEEEIVKYSDQDISFLEEQCEAIKQIQKTEDPEKRKELADMLLEKDHDLTETKKFKVEVEQESDEAKRNFNLMLDDVKASLLEDGILALEAALEEHMAAKNKNDQDDCCQSSCGSCDGCDIFEGLDNS
jgi:hypothetical protein